MSKIKIGFARLLSLCLVFILIVGALATVGAFAEGEQTESAEAGTSEGSDEVVEESPDYFFYDTNALDGMKGYGHRTDLSVVSDDLGFDALRMTISGDGSDPYLSFTVPDEFSTEKYSFIAFFLKKPTSASTFQAFFKGTDNEKYTEQESIKAKYKSNNKWQIIVLEMSELDIKGNLEQFRIDCHPGSSSAIGEYCDVAGVAFGMTEDDAIRPICELLGKGESVVYHFSNFSEEEKQYVCTWAYKTDAGLSNGNIIYRNVGKGDANADDAMSMWNIEEHLQYLGHPVLDAHDFGYIVIKYKAHVKDGIEQRFEIFYQTDWRTEAAYGYSVFETYRANDEWQGMQLNLKDGIEWVGTVHSFRIDWSNGLPAGTEGIMKISDVYLFKDSKSAAAINKIMNNVVVVRVGDDADMTVETTEVITEAPWGSETIGIVTDEPQSEEPTEETTEETIPEFIETTEEITEDTSESSAENESEQTTEKITDATEKKPLNQEENIGDSDLLGTDDAEKKGSEMPFYIACACLALLSLLSVATVVVIRTKNR